MIFLPWRFPSRRRMVGREHLLGTVSMHMVAVNKIIFQSSKLLYQNTWEHLEKRNIP